MKQHNYYVYIVTNYLSSAFYIGVTNDLERRIVEHKSRLIGGFSKKYHLTRLIYFEDCSRIEDAIAREKQLKNWHREWKLNLIRNFNPDLKDLYPTVEDAATTLRRQSKKRACEGLL